MPEDNDSEVMRIVQQLSAESWVDGAFVVNSSGMMVASSGKIPCEDVTTLGVLIWGIYSSAEQIHLLLGDGGMPSLTHQSNNLKIFLFGLPDKGGILTVLAGTRTLNTEQLQLIRQTCQDISVLLPENDGNWMQMTEPDFTGPVEGPVDESHRFSLELAAQAVESNLDIDEDLFLAMESESSEDDHESASGDLSHRHHGGGEADSDEASPEGTS
jgi:predicted regulator of Ras-like GTPase activity (Roadblock/LC7/MglB family)